MNSKSKTVKVTADIAGNVIIPSKNNMEWGHIRVEQEKMVIDDRGFARKKKVSALISGTINDLKGFGWNANEMIEGHVVFKEQLKPFNKKDPERDFKIAGKTNIVCCIDGEPIYRKTFYTQLDDARNTYITDEFGNILNHTNGEAIREAYLELSEKEESVENVNLSNL